MIPKFYSYTDAGAPSVSAGDIASISKILDACLITGYGASTAAGWTASYTGTVGATANCVLDIDSTSGNAITGAYGGVVLQSGTTTLSTPGTGDYTFELWARFRSHRSNNNLALLHASSGGLWGFTGNGTYFYAYHANTAITMATVASAVSLNTWYHFALTRQGSTVRAFLNGTQVGATITSAANITVANMVFGYNSPSAPTLGYAFDGYIAGIRYTTGTALYTTTFSAPTAAPTAVTGTNLLINPSGAYRSTSVSDLSTASVGLTTTSVFVSNQVPDPWNNYNPSTTDWHLYENTAGTALSLYCNSRSGSLIQGYAAATSLTGGSFPSLPGEFYSGTAVPVWLSNYNTSANAADATKLLKWTVAATDKFFYLNIALAKGAAVDETSRINYLDSIVQYPRDNLYNATWVFGGIEDLQTAGISGIMNYEMSSAIPNAFYQTPMSFTYRANRYIGSATSGHSGLAIIANNINAYAVSGTCAMVLQSFRDITFLDSSFSTLQNTILGAEGKAPVNIDHDAEWTAHLMKVPIIGGASSGTGTNYLHQHLGNMPGLYILSLPYSTVSKHFDTLTIRSIKTNTSINLRVLQVLAGAGNTLTHALYLNEGNWT